MNCPVSKKLELAVRAVIVEVNLRNKARMHYVESRACEWDSELMGFLEQSIVEAELRSTAARKLLEIHTGTCPFCRTKNGN